MFIIWTNLCPSLLILKFKVDENHDDSFLSCSASIQSLSQPSEPSIIKGTTSPRLASTVFSAALQSPDTMDDTHLLIQ